MGKLTIKELEALRIGDVGKVVIDDNGLRGRVRANREAKHGVSVTFVYRFRWENTTQDYSCGTWPSETLPHVRKNRDRARNLLGDGINPTQHKRIALQAAKEAAAAKLAEIERQNADRLTVADLFDTWLADGVRRKDDNAELLRSFKADVLPKIGSKAIKELTEHDLRIVLRAMAGRGVNRATVIMRDSLTQMFAWAEKRQPWRKLLADGNPMDLIEIEKIVSPDYDLNNQRDRILSADELRELRDIFKRTQDEYDNAPNKRSAAHPLDKVTRLALWIMLSTLCRVGETSMARWEHVNLEVGEWFIPQKNVKGQVASHTVYLSDFALNQFRQLKEITGESDWCFPAKNKENAHVCVKSMSKQIGDRQSMFKKSKDGTPRKPMKRRRHDSTLVLSDGKNGAWTPHDLRRTGATMMQSLGVSLDIIDRCQNHVLAGSKVRRHYFHHDYAKEKREAWRLLGERLTLLSSPPSNLISGEFGKVA